MKNNKKFLLILSTVALLAGCGEKTPSNSEGDLSNNPSINESVPGTSESVLPSNPSEIVTSSDSSEPSVVTPQIVVGGVSLADSFVEFAANQTGKTETHRSKYMVLDREYVVGDDNNFNVKPNAYFIDLETIEEVFDIEWEYDIKVTSSDIDVTLDSNIIENIDNVNCLVDFAEGAIGNSYIIRVIPRNLTAKQMENVIEYTTYVSVKVVDGYNVYDAKELSYMNNYDGDLSDKTSSTTINFKEIWDNFKTENNLKLNYLPKAMILHNNIQLSVDDLPTEFFLSEKDVAGASDADRALGSLKDWNELYTRVLEENETFDFYGNYFNLDASSIPVVVRDGKNPMAEGSTIISHAVLLKFEGDETGKVSINDTNLVGNSPRQENTTLSGGLIFNKCEGPEMLAYNNIAKCWFITYMPNYSKSAYVMDSCKAYDNFNSFVYNWGTNPVTIKNSEFIGAGGPVIIQDHVDHDANGQGGYIPKTIVENSLLESYVTGAEGWFNIVGASALVPQIKSMDLIFNAFQRSFIKTGTDKETTYMNFICVNKSGSVESITNVKVSGSLTLKDTEDSYTFDYGASANTYVQGLLNTPQLAAAPIFETSAAGTSFFNGEYLLDVTQAPIMDPTNAMFSGDYLCAYLNGMAIVFGYGPIGETHNA